MIVAVVVLGVSLVAVLCLLAWSLWLIAEQDSLIRDMKVLQAAPSAAEAALVLRAQNQPTLPFPEREQDPGVPSKPIGL